MKTIWIITKRELGSFFDSLIAYVLFIMFLGLSGLFTWLSGDNIFVINQANLQVFFAVSYWSLFFFIPAITMRTLAEENRSGTIELISTKPITDWQIISGKYLACLILVMMALALSLPYYVTVSYIGPIDHGATLGGYFGLLMLSAVYIAIGIFTSSITNNQIIALLMALMIGIFFQFLFDRVETLFSGPLSSLFHYLSINSHFESMSRGVIDLRDLIYFLSIIFLALFLTETVLSKRNWHK